MPTATVTSKGQVTIPASVRKRLRLHAGSKIDFIENKAGEVVMRPKTGSIRDLYGFIKYDGPPVSIEDMDEAIGKAIVESFEQSVK
jgi:AbrB family looped-hinge helix DNA binding protein